MAHRAIRFLPRPRGGTEPNVQRMRSEPVTRFAKCVKPIAGPPPILRCRDKVCAICVEIDIPEARVPITFIVEQRPAVSFVPERAAPAVLPVEIPRMATVDLLHVLARPRAEVGVRIR